MNNGWIKLHRKIKDWRWYKVNGMAHLFQHLIREANHETQDWQGETVNRGQVICGRKTLSSETGLSEQTVRSCLKRLKSTGEITIKSTNIFSVITIEKYETYQSKSIEINQQDNQPSNQQSTSNQPATNHKQECKELKNDKKIRKLTTFCPTSDEVRLSELLLSLILERKPDYKKPDIQLWAKHIDLMIRIDHRKPEAIERVIRWAAADSFWQNNILSTEKLRKQFDRLELKASATNNRQNLGMEHSAFGKEYRND